MSKYREFIFKRYEFDKQSGSLELYYGYDDDLEFRETFTFDFEFVDYDEVALDTSLQLLFFLAGVSYYKAYLAPEIKVMAGKIDRQLADFLDKTYQKGLGEFFYVNHLSPRTQVVFPVNADGLQPLDTGNRTGQLVGLGGGKDSLVSIEILRNRPDVATWSLNHRSQLEPLVKEVGLPHYWVDREWDRQLYDLNKADAMNGHVPISAIFSGVGLVVSILAGFRDAVVSNENSASEPTLHYEGVDINHQYSKSLEYERGFQVCLSKLFGDSQRYYSFLRPLSELRIAELFARSGFDKYRSVFSSCNRAYTHDQDHLFWCGECPKCAFVFLVFTPFLERSQIEALWRGKNLLLDPELEGTYRQLLGIEGDKPFECVGEIKEARAAMRLAQGVYPQLKKYEFDLPEDYDYKRLTAHSMPPESYELLVRAAGQV